MRHGLFNPHGRDAQLEYVKRFRDFAPQQS